MKFIIKFLATGFFTGYTPLIPGTIGTIAGALIYWFLLPANNIVVLLVTLTILVLSIPICTRAEEIFGAIDDKRIVLDEIAGLWVAMLFLPRSEELLFAGVVLFRFFDIYKPFFIKKIQVLKGGLGIVADDFFAGIFTNLILWIFLFLLNN